MALEWDSPYINRFLSADTIVPGYANPQNLNRFSYVLNNPLSYTDPTGHMVIEGAGFGGGCMDQKCFEDVQKRRNQNKNKDKGKHKDITLNGTNDMATITLTPQNLLQITNQMNHDINDPGGMRDQANNRARVVGVGAGLATGVATGPITCTTIACQGSVVIGSTVAGIVTDHLANGYFDSSYEDLQTTESYLNDVALNALDAQSEVNITVISGNDANVTIIAEGASQSIQVGSGIYYYNEVIVPYFH